MQPPRWADVSTAHAAEHTRPYAPRNVEAAGALQSPHAAGRMHDIVQTNATPALVNSSVAAQKREPRSTARYDVAGESLHDPMKTSAIHKRESARPAPSPSHISKPSPKQHKVGPRSQVKAPQRNQLHGRAVVKHKSKTSNIFCGNNALSPKLKENGGSQTIGSPSACFRKGFGAGYHQDIPHERLEEFLIDFSSGYKRLVEQPIYYGDGPVPPGMFRATLSQCRARGFGVGSMQKAKHILRAANAAHRNKRVQ